jgi:NDP-sugar pyrophosphorylase family protein
MIAGAPEYDAFILAAGLGTRLRPLTDHRPKPLVPVCGVPMLAYALASCANHGLSRVVVNAHWLSERVEAWAGVREGVLVDVSTETPDILGTGGGLRRVREQLAPRFVVVNADVIGDVDLRRLRDAVPFRGAAMALRRDPENAPRYGVVAADATGHVVELSKVARAEPDGEVDRTTHFTGIHAMDRDALEHIPDGFSCVVRTAYRALVPERRVAAVLHAGTWLDIGDPTAYLDANLAILAGGLALPLDPHARAAWARDARGTHGDAAALGRATVEGWGWVGRGARLGRAVISRSIVGEGAIVPDGAVLVDSVVWDGAQVPPGTYHRPIQYPGGARGA